MQEFIHEFQVKLIQTWLIQVLLEIQLLIPETDQNSTMILCVIQSYTKEATVFIYKLISLNPH